ncbi:uncharacterized protein LOC100023060 isoform X6 [Monodelphis domestica]|uniref:uncharacterized protein LOC100023060 isoform X6 n=1 Tax=Monodelphis domestica TaxID=13616 RepID=UPI0024E1E7DD|nr:uncharacterized protein LOC100023060 isoform X6 [Monodelphis domestica]
MVRPLRLHFQFFRSRFHFSRDQAGDPPRLRGPKLSILAGLTGWPGVSSSLCRPSSPGWAPLRLHFPPGISSGGRVRAKSAWVRPPQGTPCSSPRRYSASWGPSNYDSQGALLSRKRVVMGTRKRTLTSTLRLSGRGHPPALPEASVCPPCPKGQEWPREPGPPRTCRFRAGGGPSAGTRGSALGVGGGSPSRLLCSSTNNALVHLSSCTPSPVDNSLLLSFLLACRSEIGRLGLKSRCQLQIREFLWNHQPRKAQ